MTEIKMTQPEIQPYPYRTDNRQCDTEAPRPVPPTENAEKQANKQEAQAADGKNVPYRRL